MMQKFALRFMSDESGATAIEYALMASFVFLGIITTVTAVGTNLKVPFVQATNNLG